MDARQSWMVTSFYNWQGRLKCDVTVVPLPMVDRTMVRVGSEVEWLSVVGRASVAEC